MLEGRLELFPGAGLLQIEGRLAQVPGVFSQGATLDELDNILDACQLMLAEQTRAPVATPVETKET